jgi:MFS family permease
MSTITVSRRGIALLCAAQFVVVLDVTIVAVALPAIRDDLGFSAAGLQWVVSAYGLTFGGFLMLLGRAADLAGRRKVLTLGFALFGGASLACGLAPTGGALIAARTVQGLGAAAISPAALALLTAGVPEGTGRTRALAAWTAAAAGGGAIGWVLGGAITDSLGWQWVFLVNVVPCALAGWLTRTMLAESRAPAERLDVAGAVACTSGLAALILGLSRAEQSGVAAAIVPLAAAGLLLAAFVAIERRADAPLLPPGTLRDRRLAGALIASVSITATSTGPLFLCVLYVQDNLGQDASAAGLLFAPINLAVIAGSVAATRVHAVRGAVSTTASGLFVLAAGVAVLLALPEHGSLPPALPLAFVAIGAGVGCAALGSTAAGTEAVERDRQGLASGLLNTAAQLGNALGLAVFVLLAAGVGGFAGFHVAFATGAVVAAATALGLVYRPGAWTASR